MQTQEQVLQGLGHAELILTRHYHSLTLGLAQGWVSVTRIGIRHGPGRTTLSLAALKIQACHGHFCPTSEVWVVVEVVEGAGVQLPCFMGLLWAFHSGSREGHKNPSTQLQPG